MKPSIQGFNQSQCLRGWQRGGLRKCIRMETFFARITSEFSPMALYIVLPVLYLVPIIF